jgi:hypothetical protein
VRKAFAAIKMIDFNLVHDQADIILDEPQSYPGGQITNKCRCMLGRRSSLVQRRTSYTGYVAQMRKQFWGSGPIFNIWAKRNRKQMSSHSGIPLGLLALTVPLKGNNGTIAPLSPESGFRPLTRRGCALLALSTPNRHCHL